MYPWIWLALAGAVAALAASRSRQAPKGGQVVTVDAKGRPVKVGFDRAGIVESLRSWRYGPGKPDRNPAYITVDPAWASRYLVRIPLSAGKTLRVHRGIADLVAEALAEAKAQGAVIRDRDTGVFVERRQRWDRLRPPSLHAMGLAIDVNWTTATHPDGVLDDRIVQAFKRRGFVWGGDWKSYRDPMHFEPPFKVSIKESAPGNPATAAVKVDGRAIA